VTCLFLCLFFLKGIVLCQENPDPVIHLFIKRDKEVISFRFNVNAVSESFGVDASVCELVKSYFVI